MDDDSMEIDSPSDSVTTSSSNNNDSIKPSDRVIQRLLSIGVPSEVLHRGYSGLVSYVEEGDKTWLPEIVCATLPTDEDVWESIHQYKASSKQTAAHLTMKDQFRESMEWLQWLMFQGDPRVGLKCLAEKSVGQRGVCGAVWGSNDIAYRCRTCEHDPTCAICVPCFKNGNHKDHDYSIIYTGGGCCDCGDATAWKREGFCSKHRGAEQIQPLPNEFADSVGLVLDPLFIFWRERILYLESTIQENPRASDRVAEHKKYANELTFAVVEMLLEFCKFSESLLSFVSRRVSSSDGLLGGIVRAEGILMESVVKKLNELLLKLLADPIFKYEFAKVFLSYYPIMISEIIKELNDDAVKGYPLLSTFAVQIFTVPTLTPQLVKEMNLLHTLLGCLGDIFNSCAGEDGRLQLSKWANLFEITIQVVEDIKYVMSHDVVPKYVTQSQLDVLKSWMRLLAFVQEMNPQKRERGIHIEEENENTHLPFILCNSISNIHFLLVNGASSASSDENSNGVHLNSDRQDLDDGDNQRHAKVGWQECSVGTATGRDSMLASSSKTENECDFCHSFMAPPIAWLIHECLRSIKSGLVLDSSSGSFNESSQGICNMSASKFLAWKKTFAKFRRGKNIFGGLNSSNEGQPSHSSLPASACSGSRVGSDFLHSHSAGQEEDMVKTSCSSDLGLNKTEVACAAEGAQLLLNMGDWPDIKYDVSSQEVSVHIPFHRLLSLLLRKALRRCYGESATPSLNNPISYNELSPNLFNHLFSGYHANGLPAFIMELPLRIRVFFAEVHAGMWRRNGDAPIVSWECYRSIRWSGQDLDLDLFLLQCCAAMAPADVYLTRILERFGLSTYLSLSLEQSSEYEPTLVQEMLALIIQLVKERRFCGLSSAESLKRELVCKLATGDATRSQLVKSLPRDLSKSVELQETLDAVAQYSKPSGCNQGMYSLRRAYWKELDLYHPRWSSRDLQHAEERYLRFCGASASTSQLPRWTPIYYPLKSVARVATCKAALVIIHAVLYYAVSSGKPESRAPDSVVLTALHFLSLGLDICSQHREDSELSCYDGDVVPLLAFSGEEIDEGLLSGAEGAGGHSLLSLLVSLMRNHKRERLDNIVEAGNYNLSALTESLLKKFAEMDRGCMTKLQQLAPEVVSNSVQQIPDNGKRVCEMVSDSEKRKAKAREKQAAILAKMKAEQSKFLKSLDSTVDEESESGQKCDVTLDPEDSQDICSLCHDPNSRVPVSYLVLLQKSRLLSFTNRGPPSWEYAGSSDKNKAFIPGKCVDFQNLKNTLSSSFEGASSSFEGVPLHVVQNLINELITNGRHGEAEAFLRFIKNRLPSARNIQTPSKSINRDERAVFNFELLEEKLYTSICREIHDHMEQVESMEDVKEDVTTDNDPNRDNKSFFFGRYIAALERDASEICSSSDDRTPGDSASKLSARDGFGPADCDGIYISSCGHAVHQGCLDRYLSSLKERYVRRVIFEGGHIVDPDQGEFLCPVCRRLANAILPALPGELHTGICSTDAAGPLTLSNREIHPLGLEHAICILRCVGNAFRNGEILRAFPVQSNGKIGPDLEPISRVLFKMYFPGKQDRFLGSSRINHSMIMWDTFKYSLVSIEIAARCGRKSLKPNRGVHGLYMELDSSSGFILSLLLKIVQSTRSRHYLHVVQRFRGMQLLAESICAGQSLDYFCNSSSNADYMLDLLRLVETDMSYPDIHFWNRASDPVLARDPFSSLMWVLFCLPYPFLSCEETFLSLVHLFYVVSVTQAIMACQEKFQDIMDELNNDGCLVTEIFKSVENFAYARQYFGSRHIDASYNIKDVIRSSSLPFLRRCALLWRLLKSSAAAPFHDGGEMLNGSFCATADLIDSELECEEIEELQKMFKIPPLDFVLNDQAIRPLVLKWCIHFCKDFELRSFHGTINVMPAIPFKLMELPHLYQDLLQRCIKHRCPDCKSPLIEPALCLMCGRLCSPSWKSCCRQSGCQSHAMDCGAGTGVFLLIKRTTILLQRSARQAPWPSPYLDAFGEEDIDMQRGKPLYLNEERYAALTYMVASHGLDRSSKVLRQTTIGSFFLV